MNFNSHDFRKCLGCFTSGVTIITLMDENNQPQGVTISSFASLSLEPPMVSFNLGKESSLYKDIVNAKFFAVNILSEQQSGISRKFASSKHEKWENLAWENGENGSPKLGGVSSFLECRTANIYDGGDHSIITGEVVSLDISEDAKPLVYYKGHYFTLGEKI